MADIATRRARAPDRAEPGASAAQTPLKKWACYDSKCPVDRGRVARCGNAAAVAARSPGVNVYGLYGSLDFTRMVLEIK